MRYKNYLLTRLKSWAINLVGGLISAWGLVVAIVENDTAGAIIILIGCSIIGYGMYKLKELYFEREEKNHIFIKRGRYR